jgi:hypothetical protein
MTDGYIALSGPFPQRCFNHSQPYRGEPLRFFGAGTVVITAVPDYA